MLSSIPLLVAAGAGISITITKMAARRQIAYAKAANVVEETIGSIRTVSHIHLIRYLHNHCSANPEYDIHHSFAL